MSRNGDLRTAAKGIFGDWLQKCTYIRGSHCGSSMQIRRGSCSPYRTHKRIAHILQTSMLIKQVILNNMQIFQL